MGPTKNTKAIQVRRKIKAILFGAKAYWRHYCKKVKYTNCNYFKSQESFLPILIANYHVIEKGLAMPDLRYGFGKERLVTVIHDVFKYSELGFDTENIQFISAIQAIDEYDRIHKQAHFKLDTNIQSLINDVLNKFSIDPYSQPSTTRESFFENTSSNFEIFAKSRHSIRDFDNTEIDIQTIKEAIELAGTTPTACNKQPNKVYVITKKEEILQIINKQGGGRGFANKADKLLIVTSRNDYFTSNEVMEVYKSGGMFAMNLLYALHYKKIGACPLQWADTGQKWKWLHDIIEIPGNEEIILIIAIGYPREVFKYVRSQRNQLSEYIQIR